MFAICVCACVCATIVSMHSIHISHSLFLFTLSVSVNNSLGENTSIGCVMRGSPDVQIEWTRYKEIEGLEQPVLQSIRNMSLMTFGRQMYLIKESSTPFDNIASGNAHSPHMANQLEKNKMHNDKNVVVVGDADVDADAVVRVRRTSQLNSVDDDGEAIETQKTTKETDWDMARRTSTLYIMNTMEKDKGM